MLWCSRKTQFTFSPVCPRPPAPVARPQGQFSCLPRSETGGAADKPIAVTARPRLLAQHLPLSVNTLRKLLSNGHSPKMDPDLRGTACQFLWKPLICAQDLWDLDRVSPEVSLPKLSWILKKSSWMSSLPSNLQDSGTSGVDEASDVSTSFDFTHPHPT